MAMTEKQLKEFETFCVDWATEGFLKITPVAAKELTTEILRCWVEIDQLKDIVCKGYSLK